jgi:hypothetical protein
LRHRRRRSGRGLQARVPDPAGVRGAQLPALLTFAFQCPCLKSTVLRVAGGPDTCYPGASARGYHNVAVQSQPAIIGDTTLPGQSPHSRAVSVFNKINCTVLAEVIIRSRDPNDAAENSYSLRGTPVQYIDPFKSVAEGDWETLG